MHLKVLAPVSHFTKGSATVQLLQSALQSDQQKYLYVSQRELVLQCQAIHCAVTKKLISHFTPTKCWFGVNRSICRSDDL